MTYITIELTDGELEVLISALSENIRIVQSLGATSEMLKGASARIDELEAMLP